MRIQGHCLTRRVRWWSARRLQRLAVMQLATAAKWVLPAACRRALGARLCALPAKPSSGITASRVMVLRSRSFAPTQ